MRTIKRLASIAILSSLAFAGCKRNEAGGSGTGGSSDKAGGATGSIIIAGSTSIQPFAEHWAEAYMDSHKGVKIDVQGGGSTAGVKAVTDGAAQIGNCSRELHPDEAAKVHQTVVARDGLTIIVHPSNGVGDLSVEQVKKIYTGEVSNWKDVGGADAKINVVTRETGSGARGAFEELVLGKGVQIMAAALVQDSQGAVRQMVSSDPNAIGYVSHGVVDQSVKPLKIAGVEPSMATIMDKSYPLVRPFLMLTKGEPTGVTKEFLDWIVGPEGQAIAQKDGLFPPK
jgi:phosphate transport system substrate-binding protein